MRFRVALTGNDKFRWKRGDKPLLYGLQRLDHARQMGNVVLVEGESDVHTLLFHDIPALGLPGASNWREDRDAACLDSIPTIYIVSEPDQGGKAVKKWLATSRIRDRVHLVELENIKDPAELHVQDPEGFKDAWQNALKKARPWSEYQIREAQDEADAAQHTCNELAQTPRILDLLPTALMARGVTGEGKTTKLLYLIITSRLLERPVSAAVKGPSSAGKSFVVDQVLSFFPGSAYYCLTAMSERALAYSTEPLKHRMFVVFEMAGLQGDFASYLVRSLLSEGRLRYETVEKTKDGLQSRLIEREGPTGLIVTTTAIQLHAENETRLLSIPVTDTQDQTKHIPGRESGRPLVNCTSRAVSSTTFAVCAIALASSGAPSPCTSNRWLHSGHFTRLLAE